jgi:hypothetical protein
MRSDSVEMSEIKTLFNLKASGDNLPEHDLLQEIVAIYVGLNSKVKNRAIHPVKKYAAIIQRYSFEG